LKFWFPFFPILEEFANKIMKVIPFFMVDIFDDFLFEELPESFDKT